MEFIDNLSDIAFALLLVDILLVIILIGLILKRKFRWDVDEHENTDHSQFIDTVELKAKENPMFRDQAQ